LARCESTIKEDIVKKNEQIFYLNREIMEKTFIDLGRGGGVSETNK